MDAEQVYLFRHALVRDAAYALHLPAERSVLHREAIGCFERLFGDSVAAHVDELLLHAAAALEGAEPAEQQALRTAELRYLRMGIDHYAANWSAEAEIGLLKRIADHPGADEQEKARRSLRLGDLQMQRGEFEDALQQARVAASGTQAEVAMEGALLELRVQIFTGDVAADNQQLDDLIGRIDAYGPSTTLVTALLERSQLLERRGEREAAEAECIRAAEVAAALGEQVLQADCLLALALMRHDHERSPQAEGDARRALELARAHGDRRTEMSALNALGIILVETGRHNEAARNYEAALAIAQEIGHTLLHATISNNLANLHFYFFGNIRVAERQYLRLREYFRERGDMHSRAHANGVLGLMYIAMGKPGAARECLQAVLDDAARMGDNVLEAKAYRALAACADPDDPEAAVAAYARAARHAHEVLSPRAGADSWLRLSMLLFDCGLLNAAEEALQLGRAFDDDARKVWSVRVRQALLRGQSVDLPPPVEYRGVGPHHFLTDDLYPRLHYAAATGDVGAAHELHARMLKLAETFEADGYVRVRQALAVAKATLAELDKGDAGLLWHGVPPHMLRPELRSALLESEAGPVAPALRRAMEDGAKPSWRPSDTPLGELGDFGPAGQMP